MTGAELERHLFHMPAIASRSSGWARDFASSIIGQSKRRGWKPSPKQAAMMRRLVAELFTEKQEGELVVIE